MANYKVTDTELSGIANAIRLKGGTSEPLVFPSGFESAITNIPSGSAVLVSKTISQNGIYNPVDDNADAFSQVVVNVSGGGGVSDVLRIICGEISGAISDSTVSNIAHHAFVSASSLTGVEMNSVKQIGSYAFAFCNNMSYASFTECESIAESCFTSCYSLENISFPSVISIGSSCFANCSKLKHVSFPEATTLASSAFYLCQMLEDAYLPKVGIIRGGAFYGCKKLSVVNIPNCSIIEYNGFYSCSLNSIFLPICSNISQYAFSNCKVLESVYLLSDTVCVLSNSNAFNTTPIQYSSYLGYFGSIFVPASLVEAYKSANAWSMIADRITAYVEA